MAESGTMSAELNFLHYAAKLKHLKRTGWVKSGIPEPETVAGHMHRMSVMCAFMINDPALDINKCIKMAIIHDLGESIIGDITPLCGIDNATKYDLEVAAINKLSGLLSNPDKGTELRELFQEYEDRNTPESKLVLDLDKFDMVLQAYEYEQQEQKPKFLQPFFDSTKVFFETSHPKVKEWLNQLHAARDSNIPFSLL